MQARFLRWSLLTTITAGLVLGDTAWADPVVPKAPAGKKISNLKATDNSGKVFSLYDLKDRKAIVIVFLSFDCPVSTSYSQPLADMAAEFGKHVAFVGVTVN